MINRARKQNGKRGKCDGIWRRRHCSSHSCAHCSHLSPGFQSYPTLPLVDVPLESRFPCVPRRSIVRLRGPAEPHPQSRTCAAEGMKEGLFCSFSCRLSIVVWPQGTKEAQSPKFMSISLLSCNKKTRVVCGPPKWQGLQTEVVGSSRI